MSITEIESDLVLVTNSVAAAAGPATSEQGGDEQTG